MDQKWNPRAQVLKNWIENATYTKEDAEDRVTYLVASGDITPEQADQLTEIISLRGTNDDTSNAALATRMDDLEAAMLDLAEMLSDLVDPGEDPAEPTDEEPTQDEEEETE